MAFMSSFSFKNNVPGYVLIDSRKINENSGQSSCPPFTLSNSLSSIFLLSLFYPFYVPPLYNNWLDT